MNSVQGVITSLDRQRQRESTMSSGPLLWVNPARNWEEQLLKGEVGVSQEGVESGDCWLDKLPIHQ